MLLSTLRSSALGTPRGLLGNNGAMIDHSPFTSYRRDAPKTLNHKSRRYTLMSA